MLQNWYTTSDRLKSIVCCYSLFLLPVLFSVSGPLVCCVSVSLFLSLCIASCAFKRGSLTLIAVKHAFYNSVNVVVKNWWMTVDYSPHIRLCSINFLWLQLLTITFVLLQNFCTIVCRYRKFRSLRNFFSRRGQQFWQCNQCVSRMNEIFR